MAVSVAERGLKRVCADCGARFYDFNKRPVVCPSCQTEFTGETKVKARRGRVAAIEAEDVKSNVSNQNKAGRVAEVSDDDDDDIVRDDDLVSLDEVEEMEEADDDDITIDLDDDDIDLELDEDLEDLDEDEDLEDLEKIEKDADKE